jgi:hypothetical protein
MKNQELVSLKRQKTILLNKQCETIEQFEEVQNKLNEVEFKIQMIKEVK